MSRRIGNRRRDGGRTFLIRLIRAGVVVMALIVGSIPVGMASAADTQTITIKDDAYEPPTITVVAGDTVNWIQNSKLLHTVTADDGSFASNQLGDRDTYGGVFDTPGTFRYHCTLHPMQGTIIVLASRPSPTPAPTKRVTAAPTIASIASVAPVSPDPAPGADTSGSLSPVAIAGIVGLVLLLVVVLLFVIPAPRGPKDGAKG